MLLYNIYNQNITYNFSNTASSYKYTTNNQIIHCQLRKSYKVSRHYQYTVVALHLQARIAPKLVEKY